MPGGHQQQTKKQQDFGDDNDYGQQFRKQTIDRTKQRVQTFWKVHKKENKDMSSFMTEFNIVYNAMAKDENTKLPQVS